jgi:hypothetical protein
VGRIVNPIFIQDQRIGERTDLQQPVPVRRVPRQSGNLKTQHDASSPKAHFSHQSLKAFPVGGRCPRQTQITINDDDAIFRPTECQCPLAQSILALGALGVLDHLAGCRLADVEISISLKMSGFYFLMRFFLPVRASQ